MLCVGRYEINSLIYENFIEKNNCMHINYMLETGLMYTKFFTFI